jgi:hypothetical protein
MDFSPVADQRILVGVAATLEVLLRDQNGTLAAAGGAVTVKVATQSGATILAAGTAATTDANLVGRYTVALTAAQNPQLDGLVCTWSIGGVAARTTNVDVVGAYFASVAEIRASDPTLADELKYTDARIIDVRRSAEDMFEKVCGRAFVPRYDMLRTHGTNSTELSLPVPNLRRVRAATVYGRGSAVAMTLTATQLGYIPANIQGLAVRTDGIPWYDMWAGDNVVIEYEHGWDRPPADLLRQWFRWVRWELNSTTTGVPDRATSFSVTEGGSYSLATPGKGNSITGIPDVDVALRRHMFRRPAMA